MRALLVAIVVGLTASACGLIWDFEDFRAADASNASDASDADGTAIGAKPPDREAGAAEVTDAANAEHRGPWCQQHASAATACWDFDVPNQAIVDGWETLRGDHGTVTLTSSDLSAPSALLAKLDSATSPTAIATLRSLPFPTTRITEVELDFKPGSCSVVDPDGVSAISLSFGEPPDEFWQGQLQYHPTSSPKPFLVAWRFHQAGTAPERETNDCTSPGDYTNVCVSKKQMPLDAWHHTKWRIERGAAYQATITWYLDGEQAIDPWTVTIQPKGNTFLAVGLVPITGTAGCEARYDNITLNTLP